MYIVPAIYTNCVQFPHCTLYTVQCPRWTLENIETIRCLECTEHRVQCCVFQDNTVLYTISRESRVQCSVFQEITVHCTIYI